MSHFWRANLDDPTEILAGFPIADPWDATEGAVQGGPPASLDGVPVVDPWDAVLGNVDPDGQVAAPVSVASNPDGWVAKPSGTIPAALNELFPDETDFLESPP